MIREIVSKCPVCAAPIYGPASFGTRDGTGDADPSFLPAQIVFTCDCRVELVKKLVIENRATARRAGLYQNAG